MKRLTIIFSLGILLFAFPLSGISGFLDDLLAPSPKKEGSTTPSQKETNPEAESDTLEDLGGLFGIKKNKIRIFKRSLGVVESLEPIGEEEELTIGEAVAVEAFSRFGGEYQNPTWTRYINLVGKTVAEVSDRPTLDYHFAILNSQEHNAFAAPGGYIFITVALLQSLKNEAELAGILAHEIAHVTEKHMLETIQRGALVGSVTELTLTAMKQDPAMFANVIDEITEVLFTKGLDKDKELEADAVGVDYAYRAGYHPSGLRNYLEILKRQQGQVQSLFFTTHPSTHERIQWIDGQLLLLTDYQGLPFLTKRFERYLRIQS